MNSLNLIILILNLGCLVFLSVGVARIVTSDRPKFHNIGANVRYWGGQLMHGDKFVISPRETGRGLIDEEIFLQFKVYRTKHEEKISLIFPMPLIRQSKLTPPMDFLSILKFYEFPHQVWEDTDKNLTFYSVELDFNSPLTEMFLISVGVMVKTFKLGTEIEIEVISA